MPPVFPAGELLAHFAFASRAPELSIEGIHGTELRVEYVLKALDSFQCYRRIQLDEVHGSRIEHRVGERKHGRRNYRH